MEFETIFFYGMLGLALILIISIGRLLADLIQFKIVAPHQRLVIYRTGQLRRISGPGRVFYIKGINKPIETMDIREAPLDIEVPGVFVNGHLVSITVNIWCAFNPQQIFGMDYERIHTLIQLKEHQRQNQLRITLKDVLTEELRNFIDANPSSSSQLGIQLAPILFGSQERRAFLQLLQPALVPAINRLGYRLSENHNITLSNFSLNPDFGKSLGRGRLVEKWREQFPDLSDSELAQYVATYEGVDVGNIRKLILESGGEVEIEQRTRGGIPEERIRTRPSATRSQPEERDPQPPNRPNNPETTPAPISTPTPQSPSRPPVDYQLSRADLEVLRRTPSHPPMRD